LKHYLYILSALLVCLFQARTGVSQQGEACIFGTVYTNSGKSYTGFMQWGKEEIYWHDIFNSNKVAEKNFLDVRKAKKNKWFDIDWDIESIWEDKYKTSTRSFACYFGDIKKMDLKGSENVLLTLKNEHVMKLRGGSNDVGATIVMEDYEMGKIKLNWSKIKSIEFQTAMLDVEPPYGKPLYGVVKTRRKGKFEGYIKWDLDERHGDEILDGESDDGSKEIPFRNIVRIEKDGHGCVITLKSGREIFLDDSNDVDDGNRGIEVYQHGIGSVKVKWREFVSLDFMNPEEQALTYRSFDKPNALNAEIETYDDGIFSGLIVYDMDEMWGFEMLDGEDDYVSYQIPFRNIKEIVPKNSDYSNILFWNGTEILLGGEHDVSDRNDGILIISDARSGSEATELDWDDIIFIKFK